MSLGGHESILDGQVKQILEQHPADHLVRNNEWTTDALDFPELVIVCGHIGYPWTTEMIAVADKHPNVYIDTSAYAAHRYPGELVEYVKGRGKKKVLFGTNYPMMTASRALARFDDLGLGDEESGLFLRENARRLFRL